MTSFRVRATLAYMSTSQELALTQQNLSDDDKTFCLAVVEYGGNLLAAYKQAFGEDQAHPTARARELLARPEIALYIRKLNEAVDENALISLGSHLSKLAEIRDLAATAGQYKVALNAEVQRAESAGLINKKLPQTPSSNTNPAVVININSGSSPASNEEWARKFGKGNVVDV